MIRSASAFALLAFCYGGSPAPAQTGFCDPSPDQTRCDGTCPIPGDFCEPREIKTDNAGNFLGITCCECVKGSCHVDYNPATQQIFCEQSTPCQPATKQCTLVGQGSLDGTITWRCGCVDPASPPPCEFGGQCNGFCNPGTCVSRCSGVCPAPDDACLPQQINIPDLPTFVVCDCFNSSTNPCHVVYGAGVAGCVGTCPAGQGPCHLVTVNQMLCAGSLTPCMTDADCFPAPGQCLSINNYSCSCDSAVCQPASDGQSCVNGCATPGEQCFPKEILADVNGNFQEITCCDCGPPECHVEHNAAQGFHCVNLCPDAGNLCTLIGKGNLDGTITYACECLDPTVPTECTFISECNPCIGGSCVKHCSGPCPPPQFDACVPQGIIQNSSGQWIAECGCDDVGANCRPVFDPAAQIVTCVTSCGGGLPCPPPQVIVQSDGSKKYVCPPCNPEGACCINHQGQSFCVVMTQLDCTNNMGTWMGAGVPCIPDPCPHNGACCLFDECDGFSCVILDMDDCINQGGSYQGDNTTCNPDPCVEEVGACCVPDGPPPSGSFCIITTARNCNELFGYYNGDGTLCTPNPCTDSTASCGTANCCLRPPRFTDPKYASFIGPVAVVTQVDYLNPGLRVAVFDIKNKPSAPLNTHWTGATLFSLPSWNKTNLGSVFGVTLDRSGNIYVTASTSYNIDDLGPGGSGAVYKIDAVTGAITTFAILPNTGPGLGNIAYDCVYRQFFVTNFEDGKIYRLNAAGAIMSTFDHGVPDTGSAGFAPLGDRPWGVHVYNNRVYYAVWTEDSGRPSANFNTVWSVALVGGNFSGAAQLEITIPDLTGNTYSNPVSDFSFSTDGCMLLSQRSMWADGNPGAHDAKVLEYRKVGLIWVPSGHIFNIGVFAGNNAAGGVDYEIDGSVWATGDALQFNPQYIYGIQNTPGQGGGPTNSVLIDTNLNYLSPDKMEIGDVEIPCLPCAKPPANLAAWWPLDEFGPPTSNDIVNNLDGTWTNGPVAIPGMVARAMRFDGVNDHVLVPDNNLLDFPSACSFFFNCIPSDLSIDAWIRTCETTGIRPIVDKVAIQSLFIWNFTRGYSFYLNNGVLEFKLADQSLFFGGGISTYPESTGANLADGLWHHVAVSVDRDQAAGGKFYIDGLQAGAAFNPTARMGGLSNNGPLRIGARTLAAPAVFVDDIDEVQLFRRAITGAEVQSIYKARNAGKCKDRCSVPSGLTYCINQGTKVTALTICNDSPGAHNYNWSAAGLPSGAGCTINGPSIFAPPSGSVNVPANSCVSVLVTITAPAGLTPGQIACYDFTVTNVDTGNTFNCGGKLYRSFLWCWQKDDTWNPTTAIRVGVPTHLMYNVTNNSDADGMTGYTIRAMLHDNEGDPEPQAVRLNGLPPGTPVTGTLSLAPGQSTTVMVDVEFAQDVRLGFFDIEVGWPDTSDSAAGRGPGEPVEAISIYSLPSSSTPVPPVDPPAPHNRPKNRYLSFTPNNGANTVAFGISIGSPTSQFIGWIGTPNASGIAKVVPNPVFRAWPEATVHVGDCEIFPVASYEISATMDGFVFSDAWLGYTILEPLPKHWGDTVGSLVGIEWTAPNGAVNVNDYLAVLQKFLGVSTAPHISVCDVQSVSSTDPCLNQSGNIADVFLLIKAFQGNAYPFTMDAAMCPPCP